MDMGNKIAVFVNDSRIAYIGVKQLSLFGIIKDYHSAEKSEDNYITLKDCKFHSDFFTGYMPEDKEGTWLCNTYSKRIENFSDAPTECEYASAQLNHDGTIDVFVYSSTPFE